MSDHGTPPSTIGRVLHSARGYDLVAWLLMLGREPAFRQRLLDLAAIAPGESVLDVGCGTGTLAIFAKKRVGPSGSVLAIDASPEMIERARKKAKKAGVEVEFATQVIEALPFPDARFDAVLSTLMLHHLPRALRAQAAREMRRVLKPGGRALAVDFTQSAQQQKGFLAHFHRHGHVDIAEISQTLKDAGFRIDETGAVGFKDLHFVLATVP